MTEMEKFHPYQHKQEWVVVLEFGNFVFLDWRFGFHMRLNYDGFCSSDEFHTATHARRQTSLRAVSIHNNLKFLLFVTFLPVSWPSTELNILLWEVCLLDIISGSDRKIDRLYWTIIFSVRVYNNRRSTRHFKSS